MLEADKIGAKVVAGDVEANATLAGIKAAVSELDFMRAMRTPMDPELEKLMEGKNFADVEALKTREAATKVRQYIMSAAPPLAEVMLHKRDKFMAAELRKKCGEGTVVAVVGIAHLDGIVREWEEYGGRQKDREVTE